MKNKKIKKNILIVLGVFALIFTAIFSFQKIFFDSVRNKEKQVKGEMIAPAPEISKQGIVENLGDLEITVFQAEEMDLPRTFSQNQDTKKARGEKYYRVFLKVSNWNKKEKQTISEMVLIDNLGNFYQPDDFIAYSSNLEKLGKWVFYPMVTVDGFIIFPTVNEKAVKMELLIKNESGEIRFEFKK